jgi:hypothetical protein
MSSPSLVDDCLEALIENHLPEDYPASDFYVGLILESKGDIQPVPQAKKLNARKTIDTELLRGVRRTVDFVSKRKSAQHSFGKARIHYTRRPDRAYRRRKSSQKAGARSHIRNYRPEIPILNGNHHSGFSGLDYILYNVPIKDIKPFNVDNNLYVEVASGQFKGTYRVGRIIYGHIVNPETLKEDVELDNQTIVAEFLSHFGDHKRPVFYSEGNFYLKYSSRKYKFTLQLEIQDDTAYVNPKTLQRLNGSQIQAMLEHTNTESVVPRFSRKFKHEEPQTMPKIPYREIRNLRHGGQNRSKYMLVNAPSFDIESFPARTPIKFKIKQQGRTIWAYTPIVKMPEPNPYHS